MITKRQMCIVGVALLMILTLNGLVVGSVSAAKPSPNVFLTSITLDPEDANGQTTDAPGAWTTNLGDPLAQVGVWSKGTFLNQPFGTLPGSLGEISIQLKSGKNTFKLYGNSLSPSNLYYGAVLFFDHQVVPQAAVYNANDDMKDNFSIQPTTVQVIGSANGGAFFVNAPGTNIYTAPDGTTVTVTKFSINSISSKADKISDYYIGADGIPDTVATLQLDVKLPK